MSPEPRLAAFRVQEGESRFEAPCPYRLFIPKEAPPPSGWPLVLCLHGKGMTAEQFALVLQGILDPSAVFAFAQGVLPYEARGDRGARIAYGWYLYDGSDEPFRSSLARAEAYVMRLFDEIATRQPIDARRRFLLGYSQGAYLAHFTAVRNAPRLAGAVAISGRVREEFVCEALPAARGFPLLMVHGDNDPSLPLARAHETFAMLERAGLAVEMRTAPGGHEISTAQVSAIRDWLAPRLATIGGPAAAAHAAQPPRAAIDG